MLFANGVPPERIFSYNGADPREVTLVVLGKRDNEEKWAEFGTEHGGFPQVQCFSEIGDVRLILSKGKISYR